MSWLSKGVQFEKDIYTLGGSSRGKKRKAKHQQREAESKRNFDLLGSAVESGGSFDEVLDRLRKGYEGKPEHFAQFLQEHKAELAGSLLKTQAAKDLTDTDRFMGLTYAPGVGNIESGIAEATRAGAGGLAAAGLSASGASPALAMQARLQGGAARGNLYSNLMSQHLQNRFNLQSDVAQLSLGFSPAPRPPSQGTDWSGWASGAGALIGAALPLFAKGGGTRPPYQQQAATQGEGGLY